MKKLLFGVLALVGFSSVALGAGLFLNYPISGGPAYCASTVNGACVSTIPAAPSVGGYVPADTRLGSGQLQTVLLPSSTMGAGVDNEAPLTGTSLALPANTGKLLINPAGTIAAYTVTLPAAANLFDGQTLYINSSQVVTALTLTAGSGTTIGTATTALAVNTPIRYTYMAATTTWVKG
jgi:hypothetical protein